VTIKWKPRVCPGLPWVYPGLTLPLRGGRGWTSRASRPVRSKRSSPPDETYRRVGEKNVQKISFLFADNSPTRPFGSCVVAKPTGKPRLRRSFALPRRGHRRRVGVQEHAIFRTIRVDPETRSLQFLCISTKTSHPGWPTKIESKSNGRKSLCQSPVLFEVLVRWQR
jgi:hypothetical protein